MSDWHTVFQWIDCHIHDVIILVTLCLMLDTTMVLSMSHPNKSMFDDDMLIHWVPFFVFEFVATLGLYIWNYVRGVRVRGNGQQHQHQHHEEEDEVVDPDNRGRR